jgi:hypothetical protein
MVVVFQNLLDRIVWRNYEYLFYWQASFGCLPENQAMQYVKYLFTYQLTFYCEVP